MATRRNRIKEPIRNVPDYIDQNHRGTVTHNATINFYRIYFVDEKYQNLTVSTSGVIEGGEPLRFRGQVPFLPRQGEVILTADKSRSFRVVDVEHELNLSPGIPPRIYIILREEHINVEVEDNLSRK